jgi:alpha-beta hydrolase superfamily lysophospholipase
MAAELAGIVFVSPNIRVADPTSVVTEWPFAAWVVPWLIGVERGFDPHNEGQATFWTERYPTIALVRLGALMRETRARDFSAVDIPALFVFSDEDQVVSAAATRAFAARWGGPVTLAPQVLPGEGVDPSAHVIAGDILSPAMTAPVAATILDWAEPLAR